MSPLHRPRMPRHQEQPSPSSKQGEDATTGSVRPADVSSSGEAPRVSTTEDSERPNRAPRNPRDQLAEATARGDAGTRGQRIEAIGSTQRVDEHRPAAVRVNDEAKVRVERVPEGQPGRTAQDDRPEPSSKPTQTGAEERPDNILSFPQAEDRRRKRQGNQPSRSAQNRQRSARWWGKLPRRTRWIAGIGVLLLAALLFFGVVFYSPLLAVHNITIKGANLSDQAKVQKALDPLKGRPLTRISSVEVQGMIGNDVVVEGVSIEAKPPHDLEVTVHERIPVATVKSGDQYILVDKNGVAVGSKKSVNEAGVPLLDGGPDAVKSESFTSAVAALQTLPQSLLSQLNKVEADSPSNIRLDMKDGSQVIWGTSDQSEFKAQVLNSLVKALKDQGGASVYDVSSPDHPVTK